MRDYCQAEIDRLERLEADEQAALRELARQVRAAQERLMAIRGGLSAYRDVLREIAARGD